MSEQANEVRKAREARGWKQEQLARRAHVSVRTVRRLENGDGVSEHTHAEIMRALQADLHPQKKEKEMPNTMPADVGAPPNMIANNTPELTSGEPCTLTIGGKEVEVEDPPDELSFVNMKEGSQVVQFLEQFPRAPVYVTNDSSGEEVRENLRAFIQAVLEVREVIRRRQFDSLERFDAQCKLGDLVKALARNRWEVKGGTRYDPDWNQFGWLLVEEGIPF